MIRETVRSAAVHFFAVIHFHIRSIGAFLQRTEDEWLHNTHKGQDLIFN